MNYKKQHFISYGDDRPNAVNRIKKQAESFNTFSTIDVYSNNNIYDDEFKKNYSYVLNQKRGGGYWLWKYYLINKKIKEIDDGEYIIYCDAGCELNNKAMKRYYEYLDMLKESNYGFISFPLLWNKKKMPPPNKGFTDKNYTVRQLFDYLKIDINSEIAETSQYIGGILIIKKCTHSLKILDEYRKVLEYDQKLITDFYNNKEQGFFFKENRHDQSIWSLLRKKYGSIILKTDETFFYFVTPEIECIPRSDYKNVEEKYKYPFWATRDSEGRTYSEYWEGPKW